MIGHVSLHYGWFAGLKAWFEDEDSSPPSCDASQQYQADSCPAVDPLQHCMHHGHEQHAYSQYPEQGRLEEANVNQCVLLLPSCLQKLVNLLLWYCAPSLNPRTTPKNCSDLLALGRC